MKKLAYFLLLGSAFIFAMPGSTWAQDRPNDAAAAAAPDEDGPTSLAGPQLPAGYTARYRVTYFSSQTGVAALRSASIVSVTNHNTATCAVAVDWKLGLGGVVCTTAINVAPGNTVDFCTRTLPAGVTSCNSTCAAPGLTNAEGSAIVGSRTVTGCERIAVSARTVYTQTTTDSPVSAITDAKVVRIGLGNSGD
jgi:hypothetical protein